MLDLDASRKERAGARAAQQEGRGATLPVRWGGAVIAELDAELPLDVFAPLATLNVDIGLLLRLAFDAMRSATTADAVKSLDGLVDVFAANPQLIPDTIGAVEEVARRLLGDDGYAAFIAGRPSNYDIAALCRGVADWYGVSLGEPSASTGRSLPTGKTPSTTSNGSTASTSAASGAGPDSPDS